MEKVSTTRDRQGRRTSFVLPAGSSSTASAAHSRADYQAAPARLLDAQEELRMGLTNQQLVKECVQVNHGGIDETTCERYRGHLEHFDEYITSVHGVTFYTAKRKHVIQFMTHLKQRGGAKPHESRLGCAWCRQRNYPDGKAGKGWSASYRKSHLSAIRFLYQHFYYEEGLPEMNPAAHVPSPRVVTRKGYIPTEPDVHKLLNVSGSPNDTLVAYWAYFAPSRRATFADTLWRDIDLDNRTWEVVAKGKKVETFILNPTLVRKLREHKRWQLREAQRNVKIRDALSYEDTAYVLLTRNGRRVHPGTIYKMTRWRATRAGVGVRATKARWDAPGGKTSKMHPHAYRRAWATHSLNNGLSIDAVQEVLGHADITTTRKHYAHTKPERARDALLNMPMPKAA